MDIAELHDWLKDEQKLQLVGRKGKKDVLAKKYRQAWKKCQKKTRGLF